LILILIYMHIDIDVYIQVDICIYIYIYWHIYILIYINICAARLRPPCESDFARFAKGAASESAAAAAAGTARPGPGPVMAGSCMPENQLLAEVENENRPARTKSMGCNGQWSVVWFPLFPPISDRRMYKTLWNSFNKTLVNIHLQEHMKVRKIYSHATWNCQSLRWLTFFLQAKTQLTFSHSSEYMINLMKLLLQSLKFEESSTSKKSWLCFLCTCHLIVCYWCSIPSLSSHQIISMNLMHFITLSL
jgi:hypothetical protein